VTDLPEPEDGRERHAPVALFDGPKLRWFRGWALVGVIAASVLAGVGLTWAWDGYNARKARADLAHPPAQKQLGRSIGPVVLEGPGGTKQALPDKSQPLLVHVWLEACPDCMPAFEAMKRHRDAGVFEGMPEVNVAFGKASPAFARRYGVDENLVFDAGKHVVRPLGIGTFTTLVLAPNGRVVLVARPQKEGYAEKVRAAWAVLRAERGR
jgi:hypothetical protein